MPHLSPRIPPVGAPRGGHRGGRGFINVPAGLYLVRPASPQPHFTSKSPASPQTPRLHLKARHGRPWGGVSSPSPMMACTPHAWSSPPRREEGRRQGESTSGGAGLGAGQGLTVAHAARPSQPALYPPPALHPPALSPMRTSRRRSTKDSAASTVSTAGCWVLE
jgi:hypothetical protein